MDYLSRILKKSLWSSWTTYPGSLKKSLWSAWIIYPGSSIKYLRSTWITYPGSYIKSLRSGWIVYPGASIKYLFPRHRFCLSQTDTFRPKFQKSQKSQNSMPEPSKFGSETSVLLVFSTRIHLNTSRDHKSHILSSFFFRVGGISEAIK